MNMKKTVVVAQLLLAGTAFAMLSDEDAMKAARTTLGKMTLEEKVRLTSGSGTMTISAFPHLGIAREWMMSDNSSTIRPKLERTQWGYVQDDRNTKLQSLSGLAQTWDVAWARQHGEVLGSESRDRSVDQVLGPGVNILRTPLNGRNWEYLGEDPCLAAKLCVASIRGIQSYDVAATVKHFCLNNQELARMSVDVHVDDRTLHEIYLPAFRAAVKEGGVLSVMSSFNKVDGVWASENKYLQKGVLRDRWGFLGMLVCDWGGQHSTEFAANNGSGLEMARGNIIGYNYNWRENTYPLADAVRAGRVSAETVDEMALHTLFMMAKTGFLTGAPRRKGETCSARHLSIARASAADSVVLLRNGRGLLPLDAAALRKVLVIGTNAAEKQSHLGLSGQGNPPYEVTLYDALTNRLRGAEVKVMPFCAKMEIAETKDETAQLVAARVDQKTKVAWSEAAELKAAAEAADTVIVFTGTELGVQENMESESHDRASMDLPPALQQAMHTILDWKLPRVVVISRSGTPVGYTWTDKAETLVQTAYLGMEEGNALCDVLFGDVNPSGKLAQSWPRRYEDTGVAQCGTYNATNVIYNERFYVGYRWFDKKGIAPLFPFGFGLSYTTFAYGRPAVESVEDGFVVRVPVTNTGKRRGKEIVQLYVSYPETTVERCVKDLRGFAKLDLAPGETRVAEMRVSTRDLAYWDSFLHRFKTEAGRYLFHVGSSSATLHGAVSVTLPQSVAFLD